MCLGTKKERNLRGTGKRGGQKGTLGKVEKKSHDGLRKRGGESDVGESLRGGKPKTTFSSLGRAGGAPKTAREGTLGARENPSAVASVLRLEKEGSVDEVDAAQRASKKFEPTSRQHCRKMNDPVIPTCRRGYSSRKTKRYRPICSLGGGQR